MSSYVLDIPKFSNHVKLGQNNSCLQPDRKRPKDSINRKLFMNQKGHNYSSCVQIVVRKGVGLLVIAQFIGSLKLHQVDSIHSDAYEQKPHQIEV